VNSCVRTGFTFLDLGSGLRRTGDLFFISGMFQIRGVNENPLQGPGYVDAIAANCILCHRERGEFMDSNIGVTIMDPSLKFLTFIKAWYPQLEPYFSKGPDDGEAA